MPLISKRKAVKKMIKKKKGALRPSVYDKVKKLRPELAREDIVAMFIFDLDTDIPSLKRDGVAVADREELTLFWDGEAVEKIKLSDIEKLSTYSGVGTVYLYCKLKDGETKMLCLASATCSKRMTESVKRLNKIIEHGIEYYDKMMARRPKKQDDMGHGRICPKCGRPLPRGSERCPRCVSKLETLKRLWQIMKPHKWFILLSVVLFVAVSGLNLIIPEINKVLTDDFINSKSAVDGTQYIAVVLLMLLSQVVLRLVSVLRSHALIHASNNMIVDLRGMLFEKIQRLSIEKISKRTAGELMRRVSHDVLQIQNFLVNAFPSLIEQILLFIAIGIVFVVNDLSLLLLLILLPVPLVMFGFSFFWKIMHRLFHKTWQCGSKSNSVLHDIFSGIRVVKAFGMEHKETERYDEAASEERDMQIKSDTLWYTLMPIMQFFMCFGEFIILFYVGNAILGGEMTLGEMSKFSLYSSMIYGPLRMFSHMPRRIIDFLTSTNKVFEIIDESEEISDTDEAKQIKIKGDIDINHVSFGYDSGGEVLTNIDLHIKSGEFIGLVGKSGVGKSTLINLIMRMYDVEDGSICVDGVDIRDISQEALRSQMGVVLQETFLFSGTIYQNIAYAKPDATREEIIAVSKLAGCHNFIIKLPDGYDTKVGEKGHSLSGGERQRVAIARALLHDPRILILDEATASLDTETEKQIQDALANLSANRTTIAIAHRLSTLRNATRLVVLDKGRVAEVGSHDELMEKQGIYYGLVMAQREMSKMDS